MRKNNKGFTLIELLAIIVILAIIAVITVPIILNIIENSRKGAASDSAYGYKDSVNKTYIAELQNHNKLKLNDTYTVTNGTLSGGDFGDEEITSLPVALSGTIPSSGTLTYSNNTLTSGCLVIGDYAVTFDGGSVSQIIKGACPSPYETKFDGTYTYTTIGQYEENENGFVPVEFSNDWTIYLRNDGTKNEVCKVFPNGTVCLASNATEYDFENCTESSSYTCLKGYSKAKVDEMLLKGATDFYFQADSNGKAYGIATSDGTSERCEIEGNGRVACFNDYGDSDSCYGNDGYGHCD